MIKSFKTAVAEFTNIPLKPSDTPSGYALCYLPVFGLIPSGLAVLYINVWGGNATPVTRACVLLLIQLLTVSLFNISGYKTVIRKLTGNNGNVLPSILAFVYYILILAVYVFITDNPSFILIAFSFILSRSGAVVMLLTSNTEKSVDNVNKCMPSTVREKFFTGCFAVVGLMFAIGGMEATAPITAVVALVAVIVVGVLLNFVYEKKLGGFKIENIGFLIAVIEGIVALATLVI